MVKIGKTLRSKMSLINPWTQSSILWIMLFNLNAYSSRHFRNLLAWLDTKQYDWNHMPSLNSRSAYSLHSSLKVIDFSIVGNKYLGLCCFSFDCIKYVLLKQTGMRIWKCTSICPFNAQYNFCFNWNKVGIHMAFHLKTSLVVIHEENTKEIIGVKELINYFNLHKL